MPFVTKITCLLLLGSSRRLAPKMYDKKAVLKFGNNKNLAVLFYCVVSDDEIER